MENEYTVKQVIFALREEYLKTRNEFEKLKKYITADNSIEKSAFRYVNHNGTDGYNIAIFIELFRKMNFIQELINVFKYPHGVHKAYEIYRDSKPNTMPFESIPHITINDKEGLLKACQVLGENEFVKNTHLYYCAYKILNQNSNLASLTNDEGGINTNFCNQLNIGYRMRYDILEITGRDLKNGFVVTPDTVYNLLNLKVDSTNFNDYYKKIIENYQDKPILINDSLVIKRGNRYQILDEPEKLVLVPKIIKP